MDTLLFNVRQIMTFFYQIRSFTSTNRNAMEGQLCENGSLITNDIRKKQFIKLQLGAGVYLHLFPSFHPLFKRTKVSVTDLFLLSTLCIRWKLDKQCRTWQTVAHGCTFKSAFLLEVMLSSPSPPSHSEKSVHYSHICSILISYFVSLFGGKNG